MAETRAKGASNRGFAAMDAEKQRAIARKGGESVPAEKRSFSQNRELASAAGRKGGQSVADEDRSFSRDRSLASQAGQKGGQASHSGSNTDRS
ncbi:general stress protein [Azorhizobium doebereinerae]|uniref:general stress protein n=1 Tax=Azorhizobium doebereinerae TaxID=281091 RepID=UPI0003FA0B0A|nr:KGG domain-containing protein [Azorhizobium doebereinerae]